MASEANWWPAHERAQVYTWSPTHWLTVTVQTTGPGLVGGPPPRWFWSALPFTHIAPGRYATAGEAKAAAVAGVRRIVSNTLDVLPPAPPVAATGGTDAAQRREGGE